jgi:hypothetical protein
LPEVVGITSTSLGAFFYAIQMPPQKSLLYSMDFLRQERDLPAEVQSVVQALLKEVLLVEGMNLASGSLLKALGGGLWEFRIGRNLKSVLKGAGVTLSSNTKNRKIVVRVFCSFEEDGILLLGCYDKLRYGGERAQSVAITKARSLLLTFRGVK